MSATIHRFPTPQPVPRPPMPLEQVLPILPQMLAQIARRVAHGQPRQLATAHAELAALADYFTQISGGTSHGRP